MRRPTLSSLRSTWTYHRRAFLGWWRASLWNRLLVLAVLLYGTVFSVLTCLRILAMSAFALDLGLYNQAMYTTVAYGRFFWVSGPPPAGGGSFFGGHFSPILFLLVPPYALAPSPFTLVVIQSWAIAFSAVPVYRLAQKLLKSGIMPLTLALVFLLDPATQGVNWFDFHVEAFLLLTIPVMLYAYECRKWKWFVLAAVLTMATIEMAAVLVAALAVVILLSEAWHYRTAGLAPNRRTVLVLGLVAVSGVVWILAAGAVIRAMNPQSTYFGTGSVTWSILGASTALDVPVQVLLHPTLAWAALTYDITYKLWYLVVLLVPVQFMTLRSPRATLLCLPWLGMSLFSNFRSFYLVGNQYPAYILPFIFYGATVGLAQPWSIVRVVRWLARRRNHPSSPPISEASYPRTLIGLTVILLLVVSPIGPWGIGSDFVGPAPVIGVHQQALLDLYNLVPANASVLTQNNLYPLLSSRLNVHFVPSNVEFPPGTSFNATMNLWTSTVDYILVDCISSFSEAALVLSWPNLSSSYSVVGSADGALLLERGAHSLIFFQPLILSYGYDSVVLMNGTTVADSGTADGFALVHPNITTSHFWYGPFVTLPPGNYTVTYRLKVDRLSAGGILSLPVLLHPAELLADVVTYPSQGEEIFFNLHPLPRQVLMNSTQLDGSSVPAANTYFTMSTEFSVQTLGAYEFPGLSASGGVTMWFDNLTVVERTPRADGTLPIAWSSG